jgi:hypothetical protein
VRASLGAGAWPRAPLRPRLLRCCKEGCENLQVSPSLLPMHNLQRAAAVLVALAALG